MSMTTSDELVLAGELLLRDGRYKQAREVAGAYADEHPSEPAALP